MTQHHAYPAENPAKQTANAASGAPRQGRSFLPSYARARFGSPGSPEEDALFAQLEHLEGKMKPLRGAALERMRERFRECEGRLLRLRRRDRLWGAARPLLEHTAQELGATGESAADTARAMAILALPAFCRRNGIDIRFMGTPRTNGRTIWLGTVDFSHPAAPVYVFGHGIHEACHVLHTDFRVLAPDEEPRLRVLLNIFEDIRVDGLGMADLAGYRAWREALIAALHAAGSAFLAVRSDDTPAELYLHWLLAELESRVLGISLPPGTLSCLQRGAEKRLGRELMDESLRLAESRLPLDSTAAALSLAEDFAEMLDARAAMEEAEERLTAGELPAGQAGFPCYGSLFDEPPEPAEPVPPRSARALADRKVWERLCAAKEDLGLVRLREALALPAGAGCDPQFVERQWTKRAACVSDPAAALPNPEPAHWEWEPSSRDAAEVFDRVWAQTSDLGMRYAEVLRRRIPGLEPGAASGWEIDDAVLDQAACGESRIFLTESRVDGREVATEILIDLSGSLGAEGGGIVRAAAARLENAFKRTPGVRCRTAVFPDRCGAGPMLVTNWQSLPGAARGALRELPAWGPTPASESLLWALFTLAERREPVKLLVLFTDAKFDSAALRGEAEALRLAGIETAAVILSQDGSVPAHPFDGDTARVVTEAREVPGALLEVLSAWKKRSR